MNTRERASWVARAPRGTKVVAGRQGTNVEFAAIQAYRVFRFSGAGAAESRPASERARQKKCSAGAPLSSSEVCGSVKKRRVTTRQWGTPNASENCGWRGATLGGPVGRGGREWTGLGQARVAVLAFARGGLPGFFRRTSFFAEQLTFRRAKWESSAGSSLV